MLCCQSQTVQETPRNRTAHERRAGRHADRRRRLCRADAGDRAPPRLGPSVSVTVADPTLGKSHADDERASAIVAAARRLFETLGVWQSVAAEAQPILDMVVTDSRVDDAVRPVFLTFAGDVEPGEPFAHMIENRI